MSDLTTLNAYYDGMRDGAEFMAHYLPERRGWLSLFSITPRAETVALVYQAIEERRQKHLAQK